MIIFENYHLAVELTSQVENLFKGYIQIDSEMSESGGVLMGKRLKNGNVIITDVTLPQPEDECSRNFFKKNRIIHQQLSDEIWVNSEKKIICIGEWHTHPEGIPSPSSVDKSSWIRNVKKQNDENNYIFIIVGINTINAWSCNKSFKITKMERIMEIEGL